MKPIIELDVEELLEQLSNHIITVWEEIFSSQNHHDLSKQHIVLILWTL